MTRPNFLLLMTDQLRADALGAFGSPVAKTPHLDALAARGVCFANAYSQHSACSQSRISMLTGWYPHVAGHRTLDNLLKPWEPNLYALLRSAGYHIAWPGIRGDTFAPGGTEAATDFYGFVVPPALEAVAEAHRERFPPGHRLRHAHYAGRLGKEPLLDFDEAAVQTALALIDKGLPEPFVLQLTLFAPHPPFGVGEPWFSLHDRADMPEPLPEGTGKARFMEALRRRSALDHLEPADWAEIAATYHGMVSRLDDQLGRVITALDRAGVLDRTVTCFCSDHGEYLGDYGLVEKWPSGLDHCLLQNPLIVAGPCCGEGLAHEGMVEMIDVLPTLCELAEVEPAHVHFGRSLLGVLVGRESGVRDAAFSEGGFRADEEPQNELEAAYPYDVKTALLHDRPLLAGRATALRTEAWSYVYRAEEPEELYDRIEDPGETVSLAGDPSNAGIISEFKDKVLRWLVETSDVVPLARDPRMDPALVETFLTPGES